MTQDYTTEAQEIAEAMNAVYENKQTNKKNSLSGDYSSDSASYPTCKAVKDAYGTKKTSWASTPSDSDVPSEKLVKDSLDNKISKSSTSGLMKNDGTVDTNTYLTSTSISGKEDTSNKVSSWSTTTNNTHYPTEKLVKDSLDNKSETTHGHGQIDKDGKVTTTTSTVGNVVVTDGSNVVKVINKLPSANVTHQDISGKEDNSNKVSSWSSTTTDTHYPSEKLVKDSLDNKISKSSTSGLMKNDGTVDTSTYITSSAISGKFDTVGTGLTSNGTTVSADIGGSSNTSSSKLVACNDSRLSDARTPTSHNQATSTITNATAYNNIKSGESTTLTLTDQAKINSAINDKLGALGNLNLNAYEITSNKGTASASTMGKLYIVSENSKVNVYYTKETSGSYSWVKLDENILDELEVTWSSITGKPSFGTGANDFATGNHTHGNITSDGKVGSTSGKPLITTTGGTVTTGAFGTSSGQFAEGNHTHSGYATTSDIQSEISAFASALAEAINPSS